jgi:CBS domain-containing protein
MKANRLTVSDLMTTAVQTIKVGGVISEADTDMRLAGIRHLPVVDDRGHLVGVLSDRDLLRALARSKGKSVPIVEVMTRAVKTIGADAPARKAAAVMLELKIHCLPVVGEDGQLIGMLTESDFLRFAYEALS